MEEATTGVCDEAFAQLAKETLKNRPKTLFDHISTPSVEGFPVDCYNFLQ